MLRMRVLFVLPLLAVAVAQEPRAVPLPASTGNITVPADWQAVDPKGDARDRVATDAARSDGDRQVLVDLQQALHRAEDPSAHLLLRREGSGGHCRILHAWSTPVRVRPDDLITPDAIAELRPQIAAALPGGAQRSTAHDAGATDCFAVPAVRASFHTDSDSGRWRAEAWVVPAGERLQFFVGMWPDADVGAAADVGRIVASFDGARAPSNQVARGAIIGGCAGAIAGIVAARRRRRSLTGAAARPTS